MSSATFLLKNMNYEERLIELKLPTLRFRRHSGDMIEVYKLLTGRFDKKVADDIFEVCHKNITYYRKKNTKFSV
jgi:hypothetical protein